MIQTSPTMRILVAVSPVDFRKGIDGLAGICRQQLQRDPMNGWAFVFLQGHQLHVLLSGGNPEAAGGAPLWRPVAVAE